MVAILLVVLVTLTPAQEMMLLVHVVRVMSRKCVFQKLLNRLALIFLDFGKEQIPHVLPCRVEKMMAL